VVFLHGLSEAETNWDRDARETGGSYGTRLAAETSWTPVYLRANTGLPIAENGLALAALLDDLVAAWPTEVLRIALVGHSRGGLVIRSACHRAHGSGRPWRERHTHVVMLGTPHLGAPLEQNVNRATRLLRRVPEALPVASVLDARSAGIRDLRFGAITEGDWDGHPPDLDEDPCGDVPLLEGVRHCTISATLARRHDGPGGRLLGDLLVYHASATGAGRRRKIAFSVEDTVHLGGLTHFSLLNHPRVYAQVRDWLAETPAVPASASASA
jgi:hypothetical protein